MKLIRLYEFHLIFILCTILVLNVILNFQFSEDIIPTDACLRILAKRLHNRIINDFET